MEFTHEMGLLVAVALPVGVVALINVLLALTGESGTLLLPSLRRLPKAEAGAQEREEPARPLAREAEADAEVELRKAA